MKLLIDMNLAPRWVKLLTEAGWEAIHWSSVGKATAADSEIMLYAAEHGYVVVTFDMDFSAILAATHGEKPTVFQIRCDDVSPQAIGTQLIAALLHTKTELEAGAVVTVGSRRTRLRMLPLKSG